MTKLIYLSSSLDFGFQRDFLNGYHLRYKHLDWLDEKSRLEKPLAYTLIEKDDIVAMLSCHPENPHTAWIRYFVCVRNIDYLTAFKSLLDTALEELKKNNIAQLLSLGMPEWFGRLLVNNGFKIHSQIITLYLDATEYKALPFTDKQPNSSYTIRRMAEEDLISVFSIDKHAFSSEWQLGFQNLKACYKASEDSFVAEYEGELIAYLMSERFFSNQHISRLAVHPEHHGKSLGPLLVNAMIESALLTGVEQFSVNTNSINNQGIRAYQKLGFVKSDHSMPVYACSVLE